MSPNNKQTQLLVNYGNKYYTHAEQFYHYFLLVLVLVTYTLRKCNNAKQFYHSIHSVPKRDHLRPIPLDTVTMQNNAVIPLFPLLLYDFTQYQAQFCEIKLQSMILFCHNFVQISFMIYLITKLVKQKPWAVM